MNVSSELIKIAKSVLALYDVQTEMQTYVDGIYKELESEVLPIADKLFKSTTRKTFGNTLIEDKEFKVLAKKLGIKAVELYGLIRDYYFVDKKKDNLKAKVNSFFSKKFKVNKFKELRPSESDFPSLFLKIIPNNTVFVKTPSGEFKNFMDIFGNKVSTLEEKTRVVSSIAKRWNAIVTRIEKDYQSSNENTRLKALMAMISLQTGLRVGAYEGKTKVRDVDDKSKVTELKTFGVRTMKKEHLDMARKNIIKIQFPGKYGTENIAEIEDKKLYDALMQLVGKKGDNPIFTTKTGGILSWDSIDDYLDQFGINMKDFRTYQANIVYYDALKKEVIELKQKFQAMKGKEKEDMLNNMAQTLYDVAQKAGTEVQKKLNHKDDTTTAFQSYITPKITLTLLMKGELPDSMVETLDDNKDLMIKFPTKQFFGDILNRISAGLAYDVETQMIDKKRPSYNELEQKLDDLLI